MFGTPISTFFAVDLIITAVVFWVFLYGEASRLQMKRSWVYVVSTLLVGPQPIPRKKLTAVNLALAIGLAVNDQAIRQRAARIGELIRSEDGVRRAVEILQRYYP